MGPDLMLEALRAFFAPYAYGPPLGLLILLLLNILLLLVIGVIVILLLLLPLLGDGVKFLGDGVDLFNDGVDLPGEIVIIIIRPSSNTTGVSKVIRSGL